MLVYIGGLLDDNVTMQKGGKKCLGKTGYLMKADEKHTEAGFAFLIYMKGSHLLVLNNPN